jgi:hypothetical protein
MMKTALLSSLLFSRAIPLRVFVTAIVTMAVLTATVTRAEAQTCAKPFFPGPATVIDTSTCPLAGNGGTETNQNDAKNNFCPSTGTAAPQPMKIADLVTLQTKVQQNKSIPFGNEDIHPLTTKPGPATNRAPLVALGEGKQVVLQGFVRIARQEMAESVNCSKQFPDPDNDLYHDIHISIVAAAGAAECTGIVAEMIPRHRPAAWNATQMEAVATAKLPVRVTGQLMFDSSHTPCQGSTAVKNDPARASLWEIHPIYKFEVCTKGTCSSGAGWVPVETWKP